MEEFWPKLTDPDAKPGKKPKKMFKDCSCVLDAWNSNPNATLSRDSIINDFLKDWDYPGGLTTLTTNISDKFQLTLEGLYAQ